MELMRLGGWVMWPLLAVSIAVFTIVIERGLAIWGCPFPDRDFAARLVGAVKQGDLAPVAEKMGCVPLLKEFAASLGDASLPNQEAALRIAGEEAVSSLGKRLQLLSMLVRIAPLLGLLGTILGMIVTFSHIANAQNGVDMTLLAGGIWQALLTTAAGLIIAIPGLFFLFCFQSRVRRLAAALSEAGNAALTVAGKG